MKIAPEGITMSAANAVSLAADSAGNRVIQKETRRSVAERAEPRTSGANAKQHAQHAEKGAEEIDKLDVAQVHLATFRTETAVTLNSGSFEAGS